MTFLAPLFAWLLPLALAPVVFHLLYRVRKHPRVFPSLMFFLAADPRLSARRKLRDLLLLLLRVLALALLMLALARPVRSGLGAGKSNSVVIVLDNSASLNAPGPDGQTRLSRAQAAATALLQEGDVRRAALMTTVRDYGVSLPAGMTDDLAALQTAVAAIRPTHAAGEPVRALRDAAALCRGAVRGTAEVHILTDLTGPGWNVQQTLEFPVAATVWVHDVGRSSDRSGRVVIDKLRPPPYAPQAGRSWRLGVDLRCAGSGGRDAEVVILADAAGVSTRQNAVLSAGSYRSLSLAMPGLPAGDHPVRIRLEGAAAGLVGEAWWMARITGPQPVLLVGEVADSGLLAAALTPAGPGELTGLITETLLPATVAARLAVAPWPVMMAVPLHILGNGPFASACRDYARKGGVVLLYPSAAENRAVPATLPEWTGVMSAVLRSSTRGEPLLAARPDATFWDDLRDAQGQVSLRGSRLQKWVSLQARESAQILAATADSTVLIRSDCGQGRIYVCGLAWDHHWSNLPRRSVFLPFALAFARMRDGSAGAGKQLELPAGVRLSQSIGTATNVTLRSVAGDKMQWSGRNESLTAPARAGVYRFEGMNPPVILAVSGDPSEDGMRDFGREPPLLAGVVHRTLPYQNAAGVRREVFAARRGTNLFGAFLTLAILFWVFELWLACRPL